MIPTLPPSADRLTADALRDAAVKTGTNWSDRQAATLQLYALCVQLITARDHKRAQAIAALARR